jgi:iron complex transport system ATP-binding protein
MLEMKDITAGYGETMILRNISLDFPRGTVTAVLGPNGCGKSTLLKAAAGLLPLAAGEISAPRPRARHIAYLPQSRRLPEMTARQLVLQGRYPWLGWPRRYGERDLALAEAAMERLGVEEYAHRPLSELSGGTRQRCYLAMTLAQDPEVFLLDEPTSFLDPLHQLRLLDLCRELAAEGRAVAVVLHDLPLALRYADRAAVMKEGRLLAVDSPERLLERGILEQVFGVKILGVDTPEGRSYVCI